MNNDFIDEFFAELNNEVKNKKFTAELRKQLSDIDENKLKELIDKNF